MRVVRPVVSMTFVLFAATMGTVGTGLIYQALAAGSMMALVSGLPLALFGLYWCGRALALRQRHARRSRSR